VKSQDNNKWFLFQTRNTPNLRLPSIWFVIKLPWLKFRITIWQVPLRVFSLFGATIFWNTLYFVCNANLDTSEWTWNLPTWRLIKHIVYQVCGVLVRIGKYSGVALRFLFITGDVWKHSSFVTERTIKAVKRMRLITRCRYYRPLYNNPSPLHNVLILPLSARWSISTHPYRVKRTPHTGIYYSTQWHGYRHSAFWMTITKLFKYCGLFTERYVQNNSINSVIVVSVYETISIPLYSSFYAECYL
jgi:hypothetical protein